MHFVEAFERMDKPVTVTDILLNGSKPFPLHERVRVSSQDGDIVSGAPHPPGHEPAQEPAATGNQYFHTSIRFSAQIASFCRKILALCLISTGKER